MQIFESSLIILMVAAASSLISNAFTRAKVDLKASNETMKAYNEFLKEYRQTLKTGDKAKIEKLEKKQKQMQEMTMKVQMDRMKVSLYLLIPFLVLFYLLSYFFGASIVAISPFKFSIFYFEAVKPISIGYGMNFVTWYILTSFFTNLIASKIFGTMP